MNFVMPDLIRHPVSAWIPASAGMTNLGVITCRSNIDEKRCPDGVRAAFLF
jgi:hypothetical protein